MPMMPARVKYRKMHRGCRAGLASRCNSVEFGEDVLQSLERCWLDTKQIEAARVAITSLAHVEYHRDIDRELARSAGRHVLGTGHGFR